MKNLELEHTPAEDLEDDIRWCPSTDNESLLSKQVKRLADLLAYNESVGEGLCWRSYVCSDAFGRKMSRVLNDYCS